MPCGDGNALAQESGLPPSPSLSRPGTPSQPVDERGFIRRWLLLEPIAVSGQLTERPVQQALQRTPFATPLAVPAEGTTVDPGTGGPLRWHAVETVRYNVNLYHFARALSKPTSNVLFWVTSVVDSPVEIRGARLAICSNAASNWWLNGERVVALYNDRQSVIDDGVSRRLTLKKGRNVIRGAIINGGGATDFCARILDADDRPVTNLMVSLDPAPAAPGD